MRSGGIIKEVESFTDSGMEQTNDAKREMIEIGGKMEEAEQWIRDMLSEMRALVVRGNSTGTTVIQDANDGIAKAAGLEKFLNESAVNDFDDMEDRNREEIKMFTEGLLEKLESFDKTVQERVDKV